MKRHFVLAALVAALVVGHAANASADPAADRCGGSKTKAAARYAKDVFSCHAHALRSGETVDAGCTATAATRLGTAFRKAEALGGCATADDEGGAQAIVDAARAAVDALLAPEQTDQARLCAAAKVQAAGRHVHGGLRCYGKTAVRGLPPSEGCLANAYERLVAGFSAAETRGGCTTTGDLDQVRDIDEDAHNDLVRALSPVCGDGIAGPSQECEDGDDATCPGLCDDTCACNLPPECGDGISEMPEECDDGDLDDGDGCSSFCQLENESALCTGIAPAAGTAIDAVFVSDDFTVPTFLTAPRLDPLRLYVTERAGYIRVLSLVDGTVNPTPFLDISNLTTTGGERGLFSMAFDPDYDSNGRFFVSYTNLSGDLVLARYEVDQGDPTVADESTRQELLVVPHPGAANHNGGQLQFGGDGYLYWSMGDGGSGHNSQDDTLLLGKLLRLDVDHDSAPFITVPASNPGYAGGTSDIEYVWSKGLRNPWRFSFDRLTGDLYIGDVGGQQIEEIDFAPGASTGGENYGWGIFEGTRCRMEPCPDPPTGFTMPVHEYTHGRGCAVMGGYAYRGCAMPDFAGTYFFSDLCGAWVRTFEVAGGAATELTDRTNDAKSAGAFFAGVVSWGEDARGELYMISNNTIYRIEPQ
ncbi:MAG TPA: PQQ-dependent sugar dehydrogenase [Candidatus Limnocylindrales bacterium]|nr:PQQ-dependent sugar dehydrogenase [Candidatus Limnocylindrales bacterium]